MGGRGDPPALGTCLWRIRRRVTVAAVGLMVGVEFAGAAFNKAILGRLPDNGGLAARSDAARPLGKATAVVIHRLGRTRRGLGGRGVG
ncbi:hypothetical protein [Streptomyces carpinensis]|uniref:Uncharacterized protein n=1 Tax=Streptomyces carpinensis TaxID=66369 RepID=A0ABV1W2Z6_9ACTN|nr:hypothetical protein [Streptomyces carpinensis]